MKTRHALPLATAVAVAGAVLGLFLTAHAPGVSADSTRYLAGAESLLAGEGFRGPAGGVMTHYPPLYSLALSGAMALGRTPLEAARALGALCLAASAASVALLAAAAGASLPVAVLAALAYLTTREILEIHAMAWSEPPFIALLLGALVLLLVNPPVERARARRRRLLSALLAGAAGLTRWVGPAWIPALMLASTLDVDGRTRRERARDALGYGVVAALPIALWTLRNRLVGESTANRALAARALDAGALERLRMLVGDLWLPDVPGVRAALAIAAGAMLVAGMVSAARAPVARALLGAAIVAVLGYGCFVVAAMTFVVGKIPATPRLVSPLAPFGPLAIVAAGTLLATRVGRDAPRHAVAALLVAAVVAAAPDAIRDARDLAANGRGFSATRWSRSEAVAYVAALPASVRIHSNARDLLEHATGRRVLGVPRARVPVSHAPNPELDDELEALAREMRHAGAVAVMLDDFEWRRYFPTAAELEERGLPVARELSDATVFGVSAAPTR